MRTRVEIDDQLLAQVMQLGQFPTKKAAIHAALEEFVKTLKCQQLRASRGKLDWQGDLDQMRASRTNGVDRSSAG
jgi:Arc/MetJ family transcription regulator